MDKTGVESVCQTVQQGYQSASPSSEKYRNKCARVLGNLVWQHSPVSTPAQRNLEALEKSFVTSMSFHEEFHIGKAITRLALLVSHCEVSVFSVNFKSWPA